MIQKNELNLQNFATRRLCELIAKCERGETLTESERRILREEVFQ